MGRLAEVHRDWRDGRGYGYPICCIAHYCWDVLLGRAPTTTRYAQALYDTSTPVSRWDWRPRAWDHQRQIPCGVFHTRGSTLGVQARLWRIAMYNLRGPRGPVLMAHAIPAEPDPLVAWADHSEYDSWLTGIYLDRALDWN
jgi:hypothetical protein